MRLKVWCALVTIFWLLALALLLAARDESTAVYPRSRVAPVTLAWEQFWRAWQACGLISNRTLLLRDLDPGARATAGVLGVLWTDWPAVLAAIQQQPHCRIKLEQVVTMGKPIMADVSSLERRIAISTAAAAATQPANTAWATVQLQGTPDLHVVLVIMYPAPGNEFAWVASPTPSTWGDPTAWSPPVPVPGSIDAAPWAVPMLAAEKWQGRVARIVFSQSGFTAPVSLPEPPRWAATLSCDTHLTRRYVAEHSDASSRLPAVDRQFVDSAFQLLLLAKRALDTLQITFWLNSGTLLGYFRECRIMAHSKDVDIGIFASDFTPNLIAAMQSVGLQLTHRFGRPADSFELSFQSQHDNVKLDIFFFYPDEDGAGFWNGGTQARTGRKFKYAFPRFEPRYTSFLGIAVRVPHPTLPFVQANYGATEWQAPIKNWDWKKSPANVKPNGEWPESDWPEVVQCNACKYPISS